MLVYVVPAHDIMLDEVTDHGTAFPALHICKNVEQKSACVTIGGTRACDPTSEHHVSVADSLVVTSVELS